MRERARQQAEAFQQRMELRESRSLAAARHLVPAGEIVPLIVPSYNAELCDLPEERKDAFRQHLKRVIDESQSVTSDAAEDIEKSHSADERESQRPRPLELAACATCRGNCCRSGDNQAYITVELLRSLRDRKPDLTAEQMSDAYLSRIPDRSYEHSCLFHTNSGCALPRELRSHVCNDFICGHLRRFRGCNSITESENVVVVAMGKDDQVARTNRVSY